MAASTINWVWPKSGPVNGGEAQLEVTAGENGTPHIRLNGVECTITGTTHGGRFKFDVPPHAAGPVAVEYSDNNGTSTLSNGYTYLASQSRYYLSILNQISAPIDLPRPTAIHAATAGAAYHAANLVFPGAYGYAAWVLGPDLPTGTGGLSNALRSTGISSIGSTGGFMSLGGFASPKLMGVRSIAAGNWTFGAAARQWIGNAGQGGDKVAVYVWRPSSNGVVGMIFDRTVDYTHDSGVISHGNTRQYIRLVTAGSAVSGIQDGDVLCLEWYACIGAATGGGEYVGYYYCNGTETIGARGADSAGDDSYASFIEAPGDLFAAAAPAALARPLVMCVT